MSLRRIRKRRSGGGIMRINIPPDPEEMSITISHGIWEKNPEWLINTTDATGSTGIRYYADVSGVSDIQALANEFFVQMKGLYNRLGWYNEESGAYSYMHFIIYRDTNTIKLGYGVHFLGDYTGKQIYESDSLLKQFLNYEESGSFYHGSNIHFMDIYPMRFENNSKCIHYNGGFIRDSITAEASLLETTKSVNQNCWYTTKTGAPLNIYSRGANILSDLVFMGNRPILESILFLIGEHHFKELNHFADIPVVTEGNPVEIFNFSLRDVYW